MRPDAALHPERREAGLPLDRDGLLPGDSVADPVEIESLRFFFDEEYRRDRTTQFLMSLYVLPGFRHPLSLKFGSAIPLDRRPRRSPADEAANAFGCREDPERSGHAFVQTLEIMSEARPHLAHAPAVRRPGETHDCGGAQREEPPGLIDRGPDGEGERRALRAPGAVVVGGDDAEPVCARTQVGVERLAARSGVLPVLVRPSRRYRNRTFSGMARLRVGRADPQAAVARPCGGR